MGRTAHEGKPAVRVLAREREEDSTPRGPMETSRSWLRGNVVHQDQTITAKSSAARGVLRRAGPRPSQTAIRSAGGCLPKQVSGHYLPNSEVTRGSYKKGF